MKDNPENRLRASFEKPELLVIYGSRLYGTNTADSDTDYRGFVCPPFEYMLNNPFWSFDQSKEPIRGSADSVLWSVNTFMKMLLEGQPQTLEMLFVPDSLTLECSPLAKLLINNRQTFISQQVHKRIFGYADAEWRKVTGILSTIEKITPDEDQILESIRNVFSPITEDYNEIRRICLSGKKRVSKPSTRHLGAKRKQQIAEFGYCVKSASHSLRLLGELEELHDTGNLTFPRPEADFLLKVKLGQLSLAECEAVFQERFERAKARQYKSDLPRYPDRKVVQKLYCDILEHKYSFIPKFSQHT